MVLLCLMKKTGVFSGETMVLERHMLRLNACKDSCEAWAFLDAGQLPEEGFHRLENVSSESRKEPLFTEQLPDAGQRMRSVRLGVSLYFSTYALLLYHVPINHKTCLSQVKWAKKWSIRMCFQVYDFSCAQHCLKDLIFLYFNSKVALFYFTRRRFFF